MTVLNDVRTAKTQQEALFAIASALDDILALLDRESASVDDWSVWSTTPLADAPQSLSPELSLEQIKAYWAARDITIPQYLDDKSTPDEVAAFWSVRGRFNIGPDGLTDHEREQHGKAQQASLNSDPHDIELPPPSPEKQERRRLFATQALKLSSVLESLGLDDGTDWTELYVKGGPLWLYAGNRDVVMTYDMNIRSQMVADLEEDSPRLAYEMSLDVLKQPAGEPDFENGSGALAVGTVGGKRG